jgi:CRISPR/Cas system-associated protein endoribonuclease Cas2
MENLGEVEVQKIKKERKPRVKKEKVIKNNNNDDDVNLLDVVEEQFNRVYLELLKLSELILKKRDDKIKIGDAISL